MSVREQIQDAFALLAGKVAVASGSFWAFGLALAVIVIWAATGPLFGFSEPWQLVINTGTTIVTFLMVFVIQHAANTETRAMQLKLNELIAASKGASNRLIDVEALSDRELEHLHQRFRLLVRDAERLEPGAQTTVDIEHDADDAAKPTQKRSKKKPPKGRQATDTG